MHGWMGSARLHVIIVWIVALLADVVPIFVVLFVVFVFIAVSLDAAPEQFRQCAEKRDGESYEGYNHTESDNSRWLLLLPNRRTIFRPLLTRSDPFLPVQLLYPLTSV
eukprot:TRINITY_DN12129_c0_g1_i1.p1 TRINITY_DN12129_c0_g1~~TRINITY_DN12129_c0_g1_i1.p1  ORF type:complete len:108 (+),score=1.31 TRINITY_DN12129_c0_g1_i1:371-694(+)